MPNSATLRQMDVLGVPVSIVNMDNLVPLIRSWTPDGPARSISMRDVHGIVRAVDSPEFRELHHRASLVVPDGMPLTWLGRTRGYERAIGALQALRLLINYKITGLVGFLHCERG